MAKSEKMADFMQVFLLCAVCTDAENEENSAVDRWQRDAYTEATSKSQAMHSDAVSFACYGHI